MDKHDLDFGGDLSVARTTPWLNKVGRPRAFVAFGIPAGVTGTISIQESAHGRTGVAGAPYATQIPAAAQPAGGDAYRLTADLETPAPFVRFLWTPSDAAGEGKLFTDDSFVAGTKPTMVFA